MQRKELKVKILVEGNAEGELVVYNNPVSFLGEVDPRKGVIITGDTEVSIKKKILVFPYSRGSTVGSYVVYALKYYDNAPKAIIVEKAEPILITGCVISEIPLAEGLDIKVLDEIKEYKKARLDAGRGLLVLEK